MIVVEVEDDVAAKLKGSSCKSTHNQLNIRVMANYVCTSTLFRADQLLIVVVVTKSKHWNFFFQFH